MGRVTLTLPRLGETMDEARLTEWRVTEGADYARGDVLAEVETDKTVVEVPALAAGRMLRHLARPGDMVALGHPLAEAEEAGEGVAATAPAPEPADPSAAARAPVVAAPAAESVPVVAAPVAAPVTTRIAASPAARAAARAGGVALDGIVGTGQRGQITAADVAAASGGAAGAGDATIVLLHGLFDDPRGWRDLPARLRAGGTHVSVPTLPPAPDVEALAEALLPGLPPGPLRLVGHSLGAAVAAVLAQRLGARVGEVILIAPAGIGARINGDFLAGMMAAGTPAALARALALLDAGPMTDRALAAELTRLSALRPALSPLIHAIARDGIQQIDIVPQLHALSCPVTVVFGTADRILNWQDVAALGPDIAIRLVPGAGHLPHLAVPGLVPKLLSASWQMGATA